MSELTPREGRFRKEIRVLSSTLHEREQELLEIKGRCSNKRCTLHYAHRGPCKEWIRLMSCQECGEEVPLEDTNAHTATHK